MKGASTPPNSAGSDGKPQTHQKKGAERPASVLRVARNHHAERCGGSKVGHRPDETEQRQNEGIGGNVLDAHHVGRGDEDYGTARNVEDAANGLHACIAAVLADGTAHGCLSVEPAALRPTHRSPSIAR